MRRREVILTVCIIVIFSLVICRFYLTYPDIAAEKIYSIQQKMIPFYIMSPENRTRAYINNADAFFRLSEGAHDPEKSLSLAYRAEHSMTLLVGEVRRMNDTGSLPSSLLFGSFTRQKQILIRLLSRVTGTAAKDVAQIILFADENEKNTKTIYYNAIHPGNTVPD